MLLGCKAMKILIDFVTLISSHILSFANTKDRPHYPEDEAGVKSLGNSEGKSVDLRSEKRTKVLD